MNVQKENSILSPNGLLESFADHMAEAGKTRGKTTLNKKGLDKVRDAAKVTNDQGTNILWGGRQVEISAATRNRLLIAGIYRLLSATSNEEDGVLLSRLERGYLTQREEDSANKPLEVKGAKGRNNIPFNQMEVIAQARSMTKDKDTLKTLDTIALYNETQWDLLKIKISDNPDSLISKAIVELVRRANEKAEKERAALLSQIEII